MFLGKQEMERLSAQAKLFISENDLVVEQLFEDWAMRVSKQLDLN